MGVRPLLELCDHDHELLDFVLRHVLWIVIVFRVDCIEVPHGRSTRLRLGVLLQLLLMFISPSSVHIVSSHAI